MIPRRLGVSPRTGLQIVADLVLKCRNLTTFFANLGFVSLHETSPNQWDPLSLHSLQRSWGF